MEDYEEKVSCFKKYVKQSMDLMIDAYKWKVMAENCDDENTKMKYMQVSDTLFNMFMIEHNNIGNMFKNEKE
jgi:hypothetical protein